MTKNNLCKLYDTEDKFLTIIEDAEKSLHDVFSKYEQIKEHNFLKVLNAMKQCNLNYTNFYWNTGYGYNDPGREKAEEIYSSVFNTEDSLVRPNIVSGTHAIYLALSVILKNGNHLFLI